MNKIFNTHEHMEFEGILSQAKKNALMVPIMITYTLFASILLLGIGTMDWEIYFRIFQYLAGDDGFWSAHLMAFIGIVMMIAFHILAKDKPQHIIVRIVEWITALIIVAFIMGGGLYIAQMLYGGGMGTAGSDALIVIGEIVDTATHQNWIDALFETYTSPIAILSLSLGIGGLSIVALYVAHHLLNTITKNISEIYARLSNLRTVKGLHTLINQSETKMADLKAQDVELSFQGEQYMKQYIGEEVLEVISQKLLPHEQTLQDDTVFEAKNRWDEDRSEENKKIAAMIKKIRGITLSDILKAMSLPKNLRN